MQRVALGRLAVDLAQESQPLKVGIALRERETCARPRQHLASEPILKWHKI